MRKYFLTVVKMSGGVLLKMARHCLLLLLEELMDIYYLILLKFALGESKLLSGKKDDGSIDSYFF